MRTSKAQPKGNVYEIVSKLQQQEAMQWVQNNAFNSDLAGERVDIKKHRLFRLHNIQKSASAPFEQCYEFWPYRQIDGCEIMDGEL
jgi:hypothetical protein